MSPLRRHGGGRPRAADSVLSFAEQWGIAEKAARRLALRSSLRSISDDAMALLACESRRYSSVQRGKVASQGRYVGGMKALGMSSRIPAARS